jgi:hypothetical protein
MYAVYDFLERFCDVRWLSPTEMDCPKASTLAVGGPDVRRAPAFRFRDAIGATGENPARYGAYVALWPAASEGFKTYEAEAYAELHKKYPNPGEYNKAKGVLNRLFLLRMRNGGEICRCNHSLYGYYDRFWEKNPRDPEAFVEKRPDFFAQGYEGKPPQMCYTSPGLVKQLAQDARDYYDGKKTGKDLRIFWQPALPNPFPIEPMDNRSYCKCPRCQAFLGPEEQRTVYSTGYHSDYFFNFVNEVAKELKKTHSDRTVVTLAYSSHAYPPKKFRLDPTVIVQYCFAQNRLPYAQQQYENELKALQAWVSESQGQRPLYLWLYYTYPKEIADNGKFQCFPGFFAHTIAEQFKLFHKLGIRGMFHCGYGQEVEAYLTFKLMCDPTQDVDALLDEYFMRMYGAASEPMKKFYLTVEQIYADPANYPKERVGHQNAQIAWGNLGTKERMGALEKLLQQAKELAKTDLEKRRVRLFELATWAYMIEGRKQYEARLAATIPAMKIPRVDEAHGDVGKVSWEKAAVLPGGWYDRGRDKPAARRLSGGVAHDGKFLYLELADLCDTKKLATSSMVFPYDDWEIFVARQRALPYRQYAVSPSGQIVALAHGELSGQRNVPIDAHGGKAISDTVAPNRWVTRLAIPLASIVPSGAVPGEKLYLNIVRVTCPQIAGEWPFGIQTWVPFTTVHEVDRLAEIVLER